jgi:hypothetical protein
MQHAALNAEWEARVAAEPAASRWANDLRQLLSPFNGYGLGFQNGGSRTNLKLFVDQIERSPGGLCISRQWDKISREKYRLEGVPILRLSNSETDDGMNVRPGNIAGLTTAVSEFIDRSDSCGNSGSNGTILLDGMEYLIARNGFDTMLKFIQLVNDKIMLSNCSVMFCIDTNILDERQRHMLLSEMTEFREN